MKQVLPIATAIILLLLLSCSETAEKKKQSEPNKKPYPEGMVYEANWESLKQHSTPQWLRDAKFGIYTHWGIYCYTATRGNATWNVNAAYFNPNSAAAKDFYEKYGELTPDFGYKDLIPKFTAEKFDAEEWADLFAR